jgi:hypothetical protein
MSERGETFLLGIICVSLFVGDPVWWDTDRESVERGKGD